MKSRYFHLTNNIGIKMKYFALFFVMSAVPLVLFLVFNTYYGAQTQEETTLNNSRQVFSQGKSFIEYKLSLISNNLNILIQDASIQRILKENGSIYKSDVREWITDRNLVHTLLSTLDSNTNGSNSVIYINGSLTDVLELDKVLKISGVEEEDWYKKLMSDRTNYQWFDQKNFDDNSALSSPNFIYAVRRIYDFDNLNRVIGVVRMGVPQNTFIEVLNRVAYLDTSSALILNKDQMLLESSDNSTATPASVMNAIRSAPGNALGDGVWTKVGQGDDAYLLAVQNIKGLDWKLVFYVPYEAILVANGQVINRILLIFVFATVFCMGLAYWASEYTTKRIRLIIGQLNQVEAGIYRKVDFPETRDEIGKLATSYNSMVSKISTLMTNQYRQGQLIKSSELKALQSQINPHFLYNTLDLIYWKAYQAGNAEICTIVKKLSEFYKRSLHKGDDIVLLLNEIEQITSYVQIQNLRFDDAICLTIDIPDVYLQYRIPKITLQPLIENAILHGIVEKESGSGSIAITGEEVDDCFLLRVSDDGVGIPSELLKSILTVSKVEGTGGYGVSNINERIQLAFGTEYGLSFESTLGAGTTVTIRLPIWAHPLYS